MFPQLIQIVIPMKYSSFYHYIYEIKEIMEMIKGFHEYHSHLSLEHKSKLEHRYITLYQFIERCYKIIQEDKGMDELKAIHQESYESIQVIKNTFMNE